MINKELRDEDAEWVFHQANDRFQDNPTSADSTFFFDGPVPRRTAFP
jgi:hypothetical protein